MIFSEATPLPCGIRTDSIGPGKIQPSGLTAAIFFIATFEDSKERFVGDHPGTSIRFNKTIYRRPNIYRNKLKDFYPCATIIPVDTDSEEKMRDKIDAWMLRECKILKSDDPENCYVFSSGLISYSIKPLRIIPEASKAKKKIEYKSPHRPLATESPFTPSPTSSRICQERKNYNDCLNGDNSCIWAKGWGCQVPTFCEYDNKLACLGNKLCDFKRGYCSLRK